MNTIILEDQPVVTGNEKKQEEEVRGMELIVQSNIAESVGKTIDKKLETFSSVEDRVNWLNSVSAKIDALLAKTTTQRTNNLLIALKNLIKEKIDTLNGVISDESLINDLLK